MRAALALSCLLAALVAGTNRANASPEATTERIYYDVLAPDGTLSGSRVLEPIAPPAARAPMVPQAEWNITTIVNNGPPDNRLDLTVIGDGYTVADLPLYRARVGRMTTGLLIIEPFARYRTYINVHRVDVLSNDSGIDEEPNCTHDTALDMSYLCDRPGLYISESKAQQAAARVPGSDQVLAMGNTTIGVGVAWYSTNLAAMGGENPGLAAHELGHSLGDLGDEYFSLGTTYGGGEAPEPNISILSASEMASTGTKWARWLGHNDPLFDGPVGTYEGAWYNAFGIYRPSPISKMRSPDRPYNAPSIEQLILQIYARARPIDGATPAGTLLHESSVAFVTPLRPVGAPLSIQWRLDGQTIPGATQETFDASLYDIPDGDHQLSVVVMDTTPWVRDEAARSALLTDTRSWTMEVGNHSPVVTAPSEIQVDEGSLAEFVVSAVDPEGTAITNMTAAGSPMGAGATFTFDPTTGSGVFRWAPGYFASGTYQMHFSASNDKSRTVSTAVFVRNVNRAPQVTAPPSAVGDEGSVLTITVDADDPDGEAVTLSAPDLPPNAYFFDEGGGVGLLAWYVGHDQSGAYAVTFATVDPHGLSGTATTSITIRETDRAPEITAPFSLDTIEGESLSFSVAASDPDGNPFVALTAQPIPPGAQFTTNAAQDSGTFDWTPDFNQAGIYLVQFTASNGLAGSALTRIMVADVVRPPILDAPGTVRGGEGRPLEFSASAVDPDGDAVDSLLATNLPAGASFNAQVGAPYGAFAWTPGYDQAGAYQVMLSAKSACRAEGVSGPVPRECDVGTATVDLVVENTDRPPAMEAPATVTVDEGDPLAFTVRVSDPDGEPVATLEAADVPLGATFVIGAGASRGDFEWTPTFAQAGRYAVRFSAANALPALAVTEIVVSDKNRGPVAAPGGPYTGVADLSIAFDGSASTDPDGEPLTYEWAFGDGGLATGASPLHAFQTEGTYQVALTVRDSGEPPLSALETTTATIAAAFEAGVFMDKSHRTIRLGSGKPTWCLRIEPRDGNFQVEDLDRSAFVLEYDGAQASALSDKSGVIADQDKDGTPELEVCFGKVALRTLFASLPPGRRTVSIAAEGPLAGGARVRGVTTVDVESGAGGLASTLSPNPLGSEGMLTFSITRPGPVSIGIYDLRGRRVRTLLKAVDIPRGYHDIPVSRERLGSGLAAGIYFYRIDAPEGVAVGKFAVLK